MLQICIRNLALLLELQGKMDRLSSVLRVLQLILLVSTRDYYKIGTASYQNLTPLPLEGFEKKIKFFLA